MTEKKIGFTTEGEQVVAFPKHILTQCYRSPLIKHLYINRMGHYPNALNHSYSRVENQHPYAVFLYCYDGEGWIKFNNKKIVLTAGNAFLFPPYSEHSYAASIEKPWSIFWIHLSGISAGELIDVTGLKTKDAPIHVVYSEERTRLFQKMLDTLSKGFSSQNLYYANLILPHYLATFIEPENHNSLTSSSSLENSYISDAIAYMQVHIEEKLSVEIIAEHVCISPTAFLKKFKKSTGYSPIAYFNFLKTQKAIQLIHTKKYNISEIGLKIGIDDPYYFSRLFKKQMGVSPRQYINEFLNQKL